MKKRHLLFAATLTAALFTIPAYAYGPDLNNPYASETGVPLTVHVDGSYVSTDVDPYISGGRTYLPLRAAAETMGATVSWNPSSETATITKGDTVIHCTVGNTAFTVNGKTQYNDASPQIVNGRTMLPIRPIAEALGGTLYWDSYTASVSIDTPAQDAPDPVLPSNTPNEVRWLVEKYYVPTEKCHSGSWYCIVPSEKAYHGIRYTHNYLFISEMPSGKQNAIMVGYRNDGGYASIGVDSMEVTPIAEGYWLKDTWTPHYWHGGGIGGGGPVYLVLGLPYDYRGFYDPAYARPGYDLDLWWVWNDVYSYQDPDSILEDYSINETFLHF